MLIEIDEREHATILAALRLWQADVTDGEQFPELPADFGDIATNGDRFKPLSTDEVDELCEQINCLSKETRNIRYWIVLMQGGLEPELHGPYPDEKEQGAEARRLHQEMGENDNLFWMETSDGHQPELGCYSASFFTETTEGGDV